jgi:hypothetical protein
VHPFVAAVLLRVGRPDPFRPNVQLHPPPREPRPAPGPQAGEGRTVIGADGGRASISQRTRSTCEPKVVTITRPGAFCKMSWRLSYISL